MPVIGAARKGTSKDDVRKLPGHVTEDLLEAPKDFKDRPSSTDTSQDGFTADLTPTVTHTSFRHASPFFFNSPRFVQTPQTRPT